MLDPEQIDSIQEYRWNFETALEMIAEEHDVHVNLDGSGYAPVH